MKVNPRENHVLWSSDIQQVVPFDNAQMALSLSEKLLGITFDSGLKFEEHINKICNIVNTKLNAPHRIVNQPRQTKNAFKGFHWISV